MSQQRQKITIKRVLELNSGEEIRDGELKGFGARRQRSVISYFVLTRVHGRLKRITIGKHDSPWRPESARREATKILLTIKSGEDPTIKRKKARTAKPLFDEVAARFLELHGMKLKPRTREEYAGLVKHQLSKAFSGTPFDEINIASISNAHASWRVTPRAANHALSVLSKMITWAEGQGLREPAINPCTRVKRYREVKRERYLTESELAQLGQSLAMGEASGENPYVIAIVKMLLLTGARVSEMLTLRWEHVDVPRRLLRLPDSKTGAKSIVLSAEALAILDGLMRLRNNQWVFPGHLHNHHLVDVHKPWSVIRSRAGLDDVRLHDLRHTFASFAVDAGGSLPLIGKLLGHSQAQTTARYAHVSPNPAQQLAEDVGARIGKAWGLSAAPMAGDSDS